MATHEGPSHGQMDEAHRECIPIVLLTQEQCGFCDQAKEILARLSHEYQLSVSTLSINSPEGQQLVIQGGLLFPPGVYVAGEPFSYGRLSERKLRRELKRRLSFVDAAPQALPSQDAH